MLAGLFAIAITGNAWGSDVLATVNGSQISTPQLHAWMRSQGIAKTAPEQEKNALQVYINRLLLAQKGESEGLANSPEFKVDLATAKVNLLSQAVVGQYFHDHPVSKSMITKRYDEMKASAPRELYRLRAIILPSADAAKKILGEIRQGISFSNLAAAQSIDKASGNLGGELGWRALESIPPSCAQAVKGLRQGEVTGPISTPNGYWVLQLLQREKAQVLPLSEVRGSIIQELQNSAIEQYVIGLRKKAQITISDGAKTASSR
ncbi:MAG: peptidyl-prolyl cis-trans isomerase [Acidithiobacillus ferrooxidans]|nr:peptidyl-prolyl cis-trans isomerase [Acidithiobacillus ferrooxidans]